MANEHLVTKSSIIRVAGNILSGLVSNPDAVNHWAIPGEVHIKETAVRMAFEIASEVEAKWDEWQLSRG